MKLGILSDIHDNVWMLAAALEGLGEADSLICCGDLCSPFVIDLLGKGFERGPIHVVFGNNDGDLFRITRNAREYPQINLHGHFFESDDHQFGGKRIAVNHYPDLALAIAGAGKYDVVCYGHNHVFKIEPLAHTLAVNPGAIMGYDPIQKQDVPSTFVIYDTTTGKASGYSIAISSRKTSAGTKIASYP